MLLKILFLHFRNMSLLHTLTKLADKSDMLKLSSWNLHWTSSSNVRLGWCLRRGYSVASFRATCSVSLLFRHTSYLPVETTWHHRTTIVTIFLWSSILWHHAVSYMGSNSSKKQSTSIYYPELRAGFSSKHWYPPTRVHSIRINSTIRTYTSAKISSQCLQFP